MSKLKVRFDTPDGYLEFYNTEKGIRNFIHLLNGILRKNQVSFSISCEYVKVKSGKYE